MQALLKDHNLTEDQALLKDHNLTEELRGDAFVQALLKDYNLTEELRLCKHFSRTTI